MAKKIRGNHLLNLGYKTGRPVGIAIDISKKLLKRNSVEEVLEILKNVLDNPKEYLEDELLSKLASTMVEDETSKINVLRDEPLEYSVFGKENIEQGAIDQMNVAMSLPVARKGAIMPDGHQGYGLPIGGVLACDNAIIPYAVGVDIGCRMCLSVYELPDDNYIHRNRHKLKESLMKHTKFGMYETHDNIPDYDFFDRPEFNENQILKSLKDKAWNQAGSSGGGNHFTNYCLLELEEDDNYLNLKKGKYLAFLSHSGSRGFGANIAKHYSNLAQKITKLPKQAQHLAWLDMNTQEGQDYWISMNMALDYASLCHKDIHRRIEKYLGLPRLCTVENHHNFADKEIIDGNEYIVHRKGSTPASENEYGIIPGTMYHPGYLVKGKGNADSLNSASHGAGRVMSRKGAKNSFTKSYMRDYLKEKGIILIGGGVDEIPLAYKDIDQVMAYQTELISIVGKCYPKVVRMADDTGEPKWMKKKKRK